MICPNPNCPDVELSGVRGEYIDSMTVCPKCGSWLVQDLPERPESGDSLPEPPEGGRDPLRGVAGEDLVAVVAFNYRHEAEVARSYLEAHGIPVLVSADDCGSADPILGTVREVTLSVRQSDVAIADDLLDELEASIQEDGTGLGDP